LVRFIERRHWFVLAGITLLALGVRLVTLSSFSRSIYGSQLMPDEQVYDFYARAIHEGKSLPHIVGFSAEVPGYVFSMAYSLFGVDAASARLLNVVLGAAICIGLYFAGEALANRATGLLAALFGALYGPFILASVTAEKTALALSLIGICAALGVRSVRRPRAVEVALFGVAVALATHVRGNALLLVLAAPVAFAWAWHRRQQTRPIVLYLGAYALGLAIVLVPLSSGGVLGATEHGFNFYLGNNLDNATPYYRPARFAPSQPDLQGGGFVLKASLDVGRTLSTAQAREHYNAKLRAEWSAQPHAAARKALAKLLGSVSVYEHAHNHNLELVSRFVAPLALPWISFGVLFPFAVLGIVRRRETHECQWLTFAAVAYWLTLVAFFSDIRLRAPFALLLMPLAAVGLQDALHRRGRSLALSALLLAVTAGATHMPVPGAGDLTTAHNLHALMLFDSGDYDGAERHYRASHRLEGLDSDSALLGLAAVAIKRGDLPAAQGLLATLGDDHYKAAEKYVQLGDILVRQRRFEEAASALEHAIEIVPGLLRVYPILELLYARLGMRHEAAHTRERYDYARQFFD
jgi:tetratricopeptide (TPR) repeat protein